MMNYEEWSNLVKEVNATLTRLAYSINQFTEASEKLKEFVEKTKEEEKKIISEYEKELFDE